MHNITVDVKINQANNPKIPHDSAIYIESDVLIHFNSVTKYQLQTFV